MTSADRGAYFYDFLEGKASHQMLISAVEKYLFFLLNSPYVYNYNHINIYI